MRSPRRRMRCVPISVSAVPPVPSKILAPVDLSVRSKAGVRAAGLLARRCGATVFLHVNVNEPEVEQLTAQGGLRTMTMREMACAFLDAWAEEMLPDLPSRTLVTFAPVPSEGVLEAACRSGADLIVTASHGRSGISRWVLGSVTERIARDADVPVMIVPSREE